MKGGSKIPRKRTVEADGKVWVEYRVGYDLFLAWNGPKRCDGRCYWVSKFVAVRP